MFIGKGKLEQGSIVMMVLPSASFLLQHLIGVSGEGYIKTKVFDYAFSYRKFYPKRNLQNAFPKIVESIRPRILITDYQGSIFHSKNNKVLGKINWKYNILKGDFYLLINFRKIRNKGDYL